MVDKLKDILSNLHTDADQETLLRYIQGHMTDEEQHELEAGILDDNFTSEALEGLREVKDKERLAWVLRNLDQDLKKKMAKRRSDMRRWVLKPQWWLVLSILILLIILTLIYIFLVHSMQNS